MKYICSIYQSSSASTAYIFDLNFNLIAGSKVNLECTFPNPGWVNQDANEIYESSVKAIKEALKKASIESKDLYGIAISNQRETTIVWDKESAQAISPALVWQSRQSAFYCEDMKKKGFVPFVKKKTGLIIDAYFSASKIRFILDEQNAQERAEKGEVLFGTVDSYLIYRLSGHKIHVCDVSNASRTLLMNIDTCAWDPKLCEIWNIPMAMLPKIVDHSEVIGRCDASIFGHEVPIITSIANQQAALLGQSGIHVGDVKNTYGSGCFLLMNTGSKHIDSKNGLVSTVAWKRNGQTTYALEGSVYSAGMNFQWLKDGLQVINALEEVESISKSVENDSGVVFIPAFVGLAAPYWRQDLKAALFGITRGTSLAHIIRASVESLAFQSMDVLKAMEQDTHLKIKRLFVDGDFSTYDFLMEFQAGILNVDVLRPMVLDTTGLGAAKMAALILGLIDDNHFESSLRIEKHFKAHLSDSERSELISGWKDAMQALLSYRKH